MNTGAVILVFTFCSPALKCLLVLLCWRVPLSSSLLLLIYPQKHNRKDASNCCSQLYARTHTNNHVDMYQHVIIYLSPSALYFLALPLLGRQAGGSKKGKKAAHVSHPHPHPHINSRFLSYSCNHPSSPPLPPSPPHLRRFPYTIKNGFKASGLLYSTGTPGVHAFPPSACNTSPPAASTTACDAHVSHSHVGAKRG